MNWSLRVNMSEQGMRGQYHDSEYVSILQTLKIYLGDS